jgi:hypothetical protein
MKTYTVIRLTNCRTALRYHTETFQATDKTMLIDTVKSAYRRVNAVLLTDAQVAELEAAKNDIHKYAYMLRIMHEEGVKIIKGDMNIPERSGSFFEMQFPGPWCDHTLRTMEFLESEGEMATIDENGDFSFKRLGHETLKALRAKEITLQQVFI